MGEHGSSRRTPLAKNWLKRELPRIPFAPDFKAFSDAGKKLADLHLNYEQLKPWPLKFIEAAGVPLSYIVADKMRICRMGEVFAANVRELAGREDLAHPTNQANRSALEW